MSNPSQKQVILNRLRQGPAYNYELACFDEPDPKRKILKYTSRIDDLRKDGHNIEAKPCPNRGQGVWRYTLVDADIVGIGVAKSYR